MNRRGFLTTLLESGLYAAMTPQIITHGLRLKRPLILMVDSPTQSIVEELLDFQSMMGELFALARNHKPKDEGLVFYTDKPGKEFIERELWQAFAAYYAQRKNESFRHC